MGAQPKHPWHALVQRLALLFLERELTSLLQDALLLVFTRSARIFLALEHPHTLSVSMHGGLIGVHTRVLGCP